MPAQRQSARQGHVYKHWRTTSTNSRSSGISNAWSTGAAAEKLDAVAQGRPSQCQDQLQQQVAKIHGRSDKVDRVCLVLTCERLTTALWSIGRYMVCEARDMFANSHEI